MKYFSSESKGFTVLELLVVLFIMTILLSIVLVSFTKGNKNTKNKVDVSEVRLIQVALEEYRAQCRVYPVRLETSARNTYPYPGGALECILEFGQLLPDNIDLSDFNYASLRQTVAQSGVCSAYHISRELYTPSRYLDNEDSDWPGDPNWSSCQSGNPNSVDYKDANGWYDLVYGIPR